MIMIINNYDNKSTVSRKDDQLIHHRLDYSSNLNDSNIVKKVKVE